MQQRLRPHWFHQIDHGTERAGRCLRQGHQTTGPNAEGRNLSNFAVVISLASQGGSLVWASAIMTAFAFGVSSIILALAFGTREVIMKRQAAMRLLAGKAKPIMGITFLLVGGGLLFGVDHVLEGWSLDLLPVWLQDFSVSV